MTYIIRTNSLKVGGKRIAATQLVDRGSIAVNFHVPETVAELEKTQISDLHDNSECSSATDHARQLHTFAALTPRTLVTTRTFAADGSEHWLAGRVTEGYRFCAGVYEDYPHLLSVSWGGFLPDEVDVGGRRTIQKWPEKFNGIAESAADSEPLS